MALFNAKELAAKGQQFVAAYSRSNMAKPAGVILKEWAQDAATSFKFDIFLSHAYLDANLVAGLKKDIEDMGFTVYVDWIQDSHLDTTRVNKATAEHLRARMEQCKSLLFATSESSPASKWMPWECGYFDGHKGKVAICPIVMNVAQNEYKGQEYLGLYPYIDKAESKDEASRTLWVNESPTKYVSFSDWLAGKPPEEKGKGRIGSV